MKKLEQFTQDSMGSLYIAGTTTLIEEDVNIMSRVGKPIPIIVKNPCLDISSVLEEMAERDSVLIPRCANAYVASDFNPDTQHIRDGKMYSVYAVQFYRVRW